MILSKKTEMIFARGSIFVLLLIFLISSLGIGGCGGGGSASPGSNNGGDGDGGANLPVIESFSSSPASISSGASSVLTWSVTGATTVSIDQGVGDVTGVSQATVTPTTTTTYTITATNSSGSVFSTASVIVAPASSLNPVWVMGYYVGYQSSSQSPDQIDYSAMTHIMIGAAIPNTDGTFDTNFYLNSVDGPAWAQETVNRAHAAGIQAILMLGGAGYVDGFRATQNPSIRTDFVNNLKNIVDTYGFDGVDIDWEPIQMDPATQDDRTIIVPLMQALHAAMPNLVYTIPVGVNNTNFDDMQNNFYGELEDYFDRVNLMSYGMLWSGGGWESWHSSPLFGETPTTPTSVDDSVKALQASGVPTAKIGVGIGFYGSAIEKGHWDTGTGHFIHEGAPYITEPHQPTDGTTWIRFSDNDVSYSNIMQYYYEDSAYRWDATARAPYLSFATPKIVAVPGWANEPVATTYVTYENESSIAEKGAYVLEQGLGGTIVWTISQGYLADWKTSGEIDPLMKAVKASFLSQ